jgi:hypothetical protein
VESLTCSSHNWFNSLSTSGVLGCAQPSFADLTGLIASAQCVAATTLAQGCVIPDGVTITIVGGKLVAAGGVASAIDAAGGTSVTNCGTANAGLFNTSGNKVGCATGQWTLLNTLTASNSATLSDTTHFTSTYNDYEIEFINVVPATSTVNGEIQVQSASSFQTTGYLTQSVATAGGSQTFAQNTTFIQAGAAQANAAPGFSGKCFFSSPSSTTTQKQWTCLLGGQNTSQAVSLTTTGYWNANGAITGFQFLFSSGNITSGTIKIYGRQ